MNDGKSKKQEHKKDEYKEKYLRALADYQNFEKRVRERERGVYEQGKKDALLKLMPFLDNLDKAEVFVKDPGMKMVRDQFIQALKQEGLEELDVLDREYDPHLAEAIELVAGDKDNIVVEVLRRGFRLGDAIVRPAQVKVSKKSMKS